MLKKNIRYLKRIYKSRKAHQNQKYMKVSKGSLVDNPSLSLKNAKTNKTYLEIGENSIVQGNFVFGTEPGEIVIGNNTFIGGGLFICIDGISIDNDVLISWGCTIADNNSYSVVWQERQHNVRDWKRGMDENKIDFYKNWANVKKSKVVIKDKAWIGFNSIILKGITIGEGSIVAAGSVVTKDVAPFTVVAGNPSVVVKSILSSSNT